MDVSPIAQLKLPKRKFLIVQYTPRLVTLIPERSSGISVDNEIFVKLHFLTVCFKILNEISITKNKILISKCVNVFVWKRTSC